MPSPCLLGFAPAFALVLSLSVVAEIPADGDSGHCVGCSTAALSAINDEDKDRGLDLLQRALYRKERRETAKKVSAASASTTPAVQHSASISDGGKAPASPAATLPAAQHFADASGGGQAPASPAATLPAAQHFADASGGGQAPKSHGVIQENFSCPMLLGTGHLDHLPMTAAAQLEIRAFRSLGLLDVGRSCWHLPTVTLGMAHWVADHSKVSHMVMLSWAALATLLVMWSLISVLIVPQKESGAAGGSKACPKRQAALVDEESAWACGFWQWASLGWADALMGSYGKCISAVAEDSDIIKERCDSDYEPRKRFRRAWDEQIQRSGGIENASLAWALLKVVGWKGGLALVLAVVVEVGMTMVGMVVALDWLLHYLQAAYEAAPDPDLLEPTIMVIVLVFGVPMAARVASSVVCLLDGHYTSLCAAGLASAVYEKALLLPASGSTLGGGSDEKDSAASLKPNVIQLLNVDIIEAWGYLLRTLVYTAVAPLAAAALLALLAVRLRLAGVLGTFYIIPALLVTWFIQMYNSLSWKRYQRHQDTRLSYLSELIVHIRTVKALAWEQLSQHRVGRAREQELSASFACALSSGCAQANLHSIPWFSLVITLFFMGMLHGGVEAYHVFVIQRIMTSLLSLTQATALGMQKLVAAPSSLARIKAFLQQQERPRNIVRQPPLDTHAPAVRILGSFGFEPGATAVLHSLDLTVPRGELVAVVGGMASGKSALLLAILGELFPCGLRPAIEAPHKVAYCAQSPWIFEGSLRENITLSQAFEEERYHRALHAAGLLADLQLLPGGDQATIGTYGLRLSSGQRARVALARAAYAEQAELVLLDDPLGSLDTATGQHIFDELVCGKILEGRTRIVVTHPDTARLSCFDRVVLMEEGRVTLTGPPAEVMASEAFRRLLPDASGHGSGTPAAMPAPAGAEASATPSLTHPLPAKLAVATAPRRNLLAGAPSPAASLPDFEGRDRFTWSSVRMWLEAAGVWNLLLFLVLAALQRGLFLAESFVLASWVDAKMVQDVQDRLYMSKLVIVVTLCCVSFILLYWAAGRTSLAASREIHSEVLLRLLQAPIDRFFDRQPLGRLINRLSFDMRQLDSAIAYCMLMLVAFCCGFILTQGYVLSTVPRAVALAALPLYAVILFYIYLYRGAAVPLVFRSKLSLSAVQDLQGTVLGTCVSIRANGMRQDFMAKHNHYSASVMRCQYLVSHVTKAWVQSRVALCYCVLTVLFALSGLWGRLAMGTLANIISLSFMALSEFEAVSLIFSNFINVLNALQRLARFLDVPQEAPAAVQGEGPRIRFSVTIESSELAQFEVIGGLGKTSQQGISPSVVLAKGGFPILRASEDGRMLELLEGHALRDLAPASSELLSVKERYHIVAANGASGCARRIAEELCSPSGKVWLDLWHCRYAGGMRVQIEDLVAGYGGEPSVLRGLSLDVPARAKVGLAGRTSCGKTTVLLSILRIVEPRAGRVLLGGRDASALGLRALRATVGLVPQEAAAFEGSWRHNLDPFGEFPDARLWEALRSVGLLPYILTLPRGLDAELARDGSNVSFGQKQLLSLARMVLRQPPVLLLDECTCGLDPRAQEAVRNALAVQFPLSTVIVVAHSAETLRILDRVVVLENGMVLEQTTAQEALKAQKGILPGVLKAHDA